jgi:hypothetical protein
MKKYIQYIKESHSQTHKWFEAIDDHDKSIIEDLLAQGFDINNRNPINLETGLIRLCDEAVNEEIIEDFLSVPNIDINAQDDNGYTALHCAAGNSTCDDIVCLLLKHPKIDVYLKDVHDRDFIQYAKNEEVDLDYLTDYDLQKTIIENNETNILIFDKYGLLNGGIKLDYPDLFAAKDWGLLT